MRLLTLGQGTTTKIVRDILLSAMGSGLVVLTGRIIHLASLDIMIASAITFFVTASAFFIAARRNRLKWSPSELGITGVWRDENQFTRDVGVSYAEYCRRFVRDTPAGQTLRILGYDWDELFHDTVVLSNDIFGKNETSRLSFQVVLMDPNSPMVIEKRMWEMEWRTRTGDALYPEGLGKDSLMRLKAKVDNCTTVAKLFQNERPKFFHLKLTPTFPDFSLLMRDDRVTGIVHCLPWKGKDSLIFEADRLDHRRSTSDETNTRQVYGTDFYGYLEGYFDSVWNDPTWRGVWVSEGKLGGQEQSSKSLLSATDVNAT